MGMFDGFSVSWVPKLGGALGSLGAILTSMGDTTYGPLLTALGVAIMGFSTRQDGKSSEAVGIKFPEVVVVVKPPEVAVVTAPLTAQEK